jgi:hypothetical protein
MNYLELSIELAKLADVSGQPSSVDNVRGEHARITGWVNQAWKEIQGAQQQWSFMWAEATPIAIVAGTSLYEQPTDCRSIIANTVYVKDAGGASRAITFKPYNEFKTLTRNAMSGEPQYWTVRPDEKISLYPAPSVNYTLVFDCYKKPQALADSVDTPSLPDQYHMAIVYLGLYHYGVFEEAPSVMQMASMNYNRYLLQMSNELLPDFQLGGTLA